VINHIGVVTVHVRDQEQALDFYTSKLGFEKRDDEPMGEGIRWLTVAPSDAQTAISLVAGYAEDAGPQLGGDTGFVFSTEDIEATHRALSARGVHFTQPPSRQPWGMWAEFADQDGNKFGLFQPIH
jgi:lactoylglutathione lyase